MAHGSAENGDCVTNGSSRVNGCIPNGNLNGLTQGASGMNGHTTNGLSINGHADMASEDGIEACPAMPIAICGMALRLPGGLATPQQLWDFLLAKGDARSRVPESRYNVSAYYSSNGKPASVSTEYGCFLDESVDLGALDTSFFSMSRVEVERADPQQRLLLEVTRECFEDAGMTNWRGRKIGCYVGSFGEDWLDMFAKETQPWGMFRVTGTGDFMLSNRISYEMDLQGPSVTVRTACSSALTCLNEACMAISRGDCEAALVGGVNLIMSPTMTTAMTEQGVLSSDGSCKTFSADANGYARGEAVTAIFAKPLSDALRDGNPVRAIIRGSHRNIDGKTPGVSVPSSEAQEALIRRAYRLAGISNFGETAMVECHGTGTPTGDPIEANAVARVFGKSGGTYIGSVKPNLGHSEGASGLVSVIKMVLALEHRVIPPNIRFTAPNPKIPFESAKLMVPLEPTPWPQNKRERVSVNSFGIGGANAHVILDSAASFDASPTLPEPPTTPQLLLYSANAAKALETMAAQYQRWVEENPDKVKDLAYTLARRRELLPHRSFAISKNGALGRASPPAKATQNPKIVMVFTGQGAQWPRMGRELLQSNATFQASIRYMDQQLRTLQNHEIVDAPQYSIEEELLKAGKRSQIDRATLSQPLCTAIQVALVDTFRWLGVKPDAVVGHSSGEIAAAYAAGALTSREAIVSAHYRGAVTELQQRAGAMAAIGMSWADTEKYLSMSSHVCIACDNSPESVTISGDADAVKSVVSEIKESRPDVLARLLQVEKAYHSDHMVEIGGHYNSLIEPEVIGNDPTEAAFFSSVTGKLLSREETDRRLDATYWRDNLENPVRFREAVTSILGHDEFKANPLFLEIGPHGALAGPLRQILAKAGSSAPYIGSMTRNQDCMESFLTAIGKLHSLGVPVDFEKLMPKGTCLPDLPRYPWNHEGSYWYESRLSREWRQRKHPYHDLLGARCAESTEIEPVWRNLFHLDNAPWVRDHKVGSDIVFPFAGYIALVGEAVRQLAGIEDGFTIRNMIVSVALVVSEGKPTEIMTTFRPHRLTDSLNSQWWEFTVVSYNGHLWNKHCTGRVMALQGFPFGSEPQSLPAPLPRKLAARQWYETMRKGGLDLGAGFQRIQIMETSTGPEHLAMGKIANSGVGDEQSYHIHPTVLDGTLQLLGAAAVNGCARKVRNWLPTSIDKLSLRRCSFDMTSIVSAKATSNMSLVGEGRCIAADGLTVLETSGIRMSIAHDSEVSTGADSHAAARYVWAPDIDFMNFRELVVPREDRAPHMQLLDELAQLCLLSSQRFLSERDTTSSCIQKYTAWVECQARLQDLEIPGVSRLENDALAARIEDLACRISNTPVGPAGAALRQVHDNMDLLLNGQTLEDVLSEEVFKALQNFVSQPVDHSRFLRCLAHSKPNLRVLELGVAGRDSAVKQIIKDLTLPDGQVLCSKYIFTSTGFISAKDQLKVFANMDYATLDISKDLVEQGFEHGEFDLVIATNVLHMEERPRDSLMNVRKLLSSDGRLLLQELCPSSKWANFIFGLQPSWWCDSEDYRSHEPHKSAKRWEAELLASGFDRIHGVVLDSPKPLQSTATIVATPAAAGKASVTRVTLLCDDDRCSGNQSHLMVMELEKAGFQITRCGLTDSPPPGQDVISLLDCDGPWFDGIDSARFEALKSFLSKLGDSGMFWVTSSTQVGCQDPRYAQVIGFARTMRSELLIDFATCEVSSFDEASCRNVFRVFQQFSVRNHNTGILDPDYEFVVSDGQIKIGRFLPFSLRGELLTSEPDDRAVLDVATPGRVNTLHWRMQSRESLGRDEVEVEVHSAGLNFRDILVAMGIVELPVRQFGLEAAGVITRTGPEVKDFQVGDRVVCLKKQAFSTYITTAQFACAKIPNDLSFDEAATMLVPYVTALHSLVNVGGLMKGQRLRRGWPGGAAGSPDGWGRCVRDRRQRGESAVSGGEIQNPITSYHAFRDASFVDGVMRETGGQGVDVVLNSLSGELLHATWSCVAEFGRMVEIGKRDLLGGGRLDMQPFLANRTYSCVDIDQLWKRPDVLKRIITSTLEHYMSGLIAPIRPIRTFSATETQDAFRYMQKGQHIGRIGISILPETKSSKGGTADDCGLEVTKRTRKLTLRKSASYLLVGGLGGLGRATAAWMADHNARELVFLSRSAGTDPKHDALISELASMGCSVQLVRGDVTSPKDVARAINAATLPLKGVVQMTMVLRDQNFESMTFEEWNEAIEPKIKGTWNLHDATAEADLDFFVMFSSLSGIIGQPGQANYASANTFLDAMVQYRKRLGLAASTVDIGAVEDIGYITQNPGLMGKMKSTGFKGVTEQDLLDAMNVAMTPQSNPCLEGVASADRGTKFPPGDVSGVFTEASGFVLGLGSTMPLESPANRAIWRKDRRMAAYHNSSSSAAGTAASSDGLKAFVTGAMADTSILEAADTAGLLAVEIGKKLFDLLLKPHEDLNTSWPLVDLGLDSLVAIELRAWWKQVFHFDISVLEMLGMGSLHALGEHAAEGILRVVKEDRE